MDISIVIPNYNGEKLLRENLPKVLAAGEQCVGKHEDQVEIIVVDDGSTDKSVEEVKSLTLRLRRVPDGTRLRSGQELKVLENKKNLGFASTVNIGVGAAKGEVVVLLNTDVAPEENFLEPLLSHFRDPNIFAVGCLDKSLENGKVILRGRGIGRWEKGFLVHGRGEVEKTDTLWVAGGSGAFRKSLWEKLGGFDEIYNPFYWEDIDLSYRAQKSGYKIYFEAKSVVTHEHYQGAIKSQYSPFQIKTIAYRNQFLFVWKNVTDPAIMRAHFLFLPYHFLKAILRGDLAFFVGFCQAILRSRKVLKRRKEVRKLFFKKDRDMTLL